MKSHNEIIKSHNAHEKHKSMHMSINTDSFILMSTIFAYGIIFLFALNKIIFYKTQNDLHSLQSKSSTHNDMLRVPENIPNVLVIGAQKSGTSYLRRMFSSHARIKVYPEEQHYFDDIINNKFNRNPYNTNLKDYSVQLAKQGNFSRKTHILVEKTPEYMFFPEEIVYTMPKDTKYIVLLRDPINRMYSAYKQLIRQKKIPESEDLNYVLTHPTKFQQGDCNPYNLLRRGRYEILLSRWLIQVDPKNILVIFTEDLMDIDYDLTRLTRFLGIEQPFISRPEIKYHEYHHLIRNETLKKLRRYYSLHNKALCKLLNMYQYKCPTWANDY